MHDCSGLKPATFKTNIRKRPFDAQEIVRWAGTGGPVSSSIDLRPQREKPHGDGTQGRSTPHIGGGASRRSFEAPSRSRQTFGKRQRGKGRHAWSRRSRTRVSGDASRRRSGQGARLVARQEKIETLDRRLHCLAGLRAVRAGQFCFVLANRRSMFFWFQVWRPQPAA